MASAQQPHAFLAFSERSGELLAHGTKAVDALAEADRLAPNDGIYIIRMETFEPHILPKPLTLGKLLKSLSELELDIMLALPRPRVKQQNT